MGRTGARPAAVMGKRPSAGRPAQARCKAKRKRQPTAPAGRRDAEANGKIAKRGCVGKRGEKTSESGPPPPRSATSGSAQAQYWRAARTRATMTAGSGGDRHNETASGLKTRRKQIRATERRLTDGNESGETTGEQRKREGGTRRRRVKDVRGKCGGQNDNAAGEAKETKRGDPLPRGGPTREKTAAGRTRGAGGGGHM